MTCAHFVLQKHITYTQAREPIHNQDCPIKHQLYLSYLPYGYDNMVKRNHMWNSLLFALIMSPATLYAQDNAVEQWTQKILLSTLSVSYMQTKETLDSVRPYYTMNAWQALDSFLGNYLTIVKAQKLTLHPQLQGPSTLIKSGDVQKRLFLSRIHYWQVHQTVSIPELQITVDFTLLVMKPYDKNQGYKIQSINMVKHTNPNGVLKQASPY